MHLSQIRIENFKNLSGIHLDLNPQINCIVGDNGSGKTNFIEAIHFLCLTKSAFGSTDSQCIEYNSSYFRIEGNFHIENQANISIECAFSPETKKIIKNNGSVYDKSSEHIGKLPLVLIAPDDTDIIRDGSEYRRKFFDGMLSQLNSGYLQDLLTYNYLIKQRNAALKQERVSKELIDIYDEKIVPLCISIAKTRKDFLTTFIPIFESRYFYISSDKEFPTINYDTEVLDQEFKTSFKLAIEKDISFQRTTKGIHTDDFNFLLDSQSLKKTGSQGQKKSFVIGLKMAQFDILNLYHNKKPILLLDDIFDKLDESRIFKLIDLIVQNTFGQIFITDARPERSKSIFEKLKTEVNFYHFERNNRSKTTIKETK